MTFAEQSKLKPKIEDVIPEYLYGDMRKSALDFVAYMRANKMTLKWSGICNRWKAIYKGKVICYVTLYERKSELHWTKKQWLEESELVGSWEVIPYLDNMDKYEESVINEGLQDFIWNHVCYCRICRTPLCHGHLPGLDIKLLGKEIKGVCRGRTHTWVVEPSETEIEHIKRLLEFEKQAREKK